MFERSFVAGDRQRQGWAFGVSLLAQAIVVALTLLIPLFLTYELPAGAWLASAVLLEPPAPPAPPPPPQVKLEERPQTQRFTEVLRQPSRIPDQVALAEQAAPRLALAAAAPGFEGGVPGGFVAPTMPSNLVGPPPEVKPIRVGGRVQAARLLEKVAPAYPEEALLENISGVVRLEAIIGRDGRIRELQLVEGHPLLAPAALEAVRQWRYKPTFLNGGAVEVVSLVDVRFNILPPPEDENSKGKKRRKR